MNGPPVGEGRWQEMGTLRITQIETLRVGEFPDLIFVQIHTNGGVIGLGRRGTPRARLRLRFTIILVRC